MAEVLVSYSDLVRAPNGATYTARACGRERPDGRWEGWLEFQASDGSTVLRSQRETTQPNRTDTEYWATGLTPVYLEGALARATDPPIALPRRPEPPPAFDGPLPHGSPQSAARHESVLNPFSVYRKGEDLLRRQLAALAGWHLVNIIEAHGLSDLPPDVVNRLPASELVDMIVSRVRASEEALKS